MHDACTIGRKVLQIVGDDLLFHALPGAVQIQQHRVRLGIVVEADRMRELAQQAVALVLPGAFALLAHLFGDVGQHGVHLGHAACTGDDARLHAHVERSAVNPPCPHLHVVVPRKRCGTAEPLDGRRHVVEREQGLSLGDALVVLRARAAVHRTGGLADEKRKDRTVTQLADSHAHGQRVHHLGRNAHVRRRRRPPRLWLRSRPSPFLGFSIVACHDGAALSGRAAPRGASTAFERLFIPLYRSQARRASRSMPAIVNLSAPADALRQTQSRGMAVWPDGPAQRKTRNLLHRQTALRGGPTPPQAVRLSSPARRGLPSRLRRTPRSRRQARLRGRGA